MFTTKNKSGTKGFTLIELLVVIAIIGILASVVLASLNSARAKSRDARRIADINQLKLALALYADSHNQAYPLALSELTSGCSGNTPCIASVPTPPAGAGQGSAYAYAPVTSSTNAATCNTAGCATFFHIGAVLEEATNQALLGDADFVSTGGNGAFDGTSADCSTVAGVKQGQANPTEKCYDTTP